MIPTRWRLPLLALALVFGLAGATLLLAPHLRPVPNGPVCAAGDQALRRVELVFGLSRKGRTDVGDTEWSDFLAREVTPRFPEGLTVLTANGQWRNAAGVIVHEPARLLLVWAAPAPDLERRIEGIRTAWKQEHRQESVLRAYGNDCVSF